ncbi:MAG: cytochrome P450 [Proteobacteria bacterium]|nr:cytochrome P450 [Pseudomonadota bacterium]
MAVLSRLRSQYRRAVDDPPHTPGPLPWLGVAIQYGKDAGAMLTRLRAEHGDTFSVFLAGDRVTFVTNPLDYQAVLACRDLDFHELANDISSMAFDHGHGSLPRLEEAGVSEVGITRMRGDDLADMTGRVQACFEEVLLDQEVPSDTETFYDWLGDVVFSATGRAVFGDGFEQDVSRADFHAVDDAFPLLLAGLPARLLGVHSARNALKKVMAIERSNAAAVTIERFKLFHTHGDPSELGAYQLAFLWATQANTLPAAFWTLAFLMNDASALERVSEEVRSVLDEAPTVDGRPQMSMAILQRLVHVDSAINEALRLTSGSLTIRVALQDVELHLEGGKTLKVRAGERVGLYPWLTHHDARIYEAPDTYRFDRFVENGKRRRSFSLDGRKVAHFLMPFGGGVSMCPGRHFARNEIKILTALMLYHFSLEAKWNALPGFVEGRAGLGVFGPAEDVAARLTRRQP